MLNLDLKVDIKKKDFQKLAIDKKRKSRVKSGFLKVNILQTDSIPLPEEELAATHLI